ncbi:unnamed protein product [Diatraea saccharalis]|uniref:Uncharacterized protein n=1 Tax=Diatraea saccharalis TaxID=40085 RepID=A0A9N9R3D4_9NEOP|nr:unnamed protein product [Diatraea saccharalis]
MWIGFYHEFIYPGLRSNDATDEAFIVEILRALPDEAWVFHSIKSCDVSSRQLIFVSSVSVEKTISVIKEINAQIATLSPTLINKNGVDIEITHISFLTMVDGRVAADISSSAVCTICGARPQR